MAFWSIASSTWNKNVNNSTSLNAHLPEISHQLAGIRMQGSIFWSENDISSSPLQKIIFFPVATCPRLSCPFCINFPLFCTYFTLLVPIFSFSFPLFPFSLTFSLIFCSINKTKKNKRFFPGSKRISKTAKQRLCMCSYFVMVPMVTKDLPTVSGKGWTIFRNQFSPMRFPEIFLEVKQVLSVLRFFHKTSGLI